MIVQSLPEAQVHVPQHRATQRSGEQVVDAHVPLSSVSGPGSMEQVVDVPVRGYAQERVQQRTVEQSRPLALIEAMPQGRVLQHIVGHFFEEPLSLDVPVLHVEEEASSLVVQELVIFQELLEVQLASSVVRAAHPMDVEQALNVPVLHMDYDDYMFTRFAEQWNMYANPGVHVPRVQQRFLGVDFPVPHVPVQQQTAEQVVEERGRGGGGGGGG